MSQEERAKEIQAELLVMVVVLVWAANLPLAKYGITGLDIFVFNGIRYVIAAGLVAGIFLLRSSWTPIQRADLPRLLRAGLIANVLYQVAFIIGLSLTTAGNSAILLATSPLWTVVIHARMHRETISRQTWIGMATSFAGVVMIIIGSGRKLEVGSQALAGDVISLAAAFFWGLNTNIQKPLLTRYSAIQVTLVMLTVGAIGLTVLAIPSAATLEWESVHWTYYAAAVVSGAVSIGLASVVWSIGVKRLGPSRTGNFSNLVPVFAFVISYFTLHEEILPIQIIGAAVTIVGVWLARQ